MNKIPQIGSLCLFSDSEEDFKNNVGVVNTLLDILHNTKYVSNKGNYYNYCKQIKIQDV